MSSQTSIREVASPSRPSQRTFLDDVILTFTSPMAWLMVVALIITWSAVAIVLFDLLDYKTLADYTSYCDDPVCLPPGLPPPAAIAKRSMRTRGGVRPIKSSSAGVSPQESTDWLEMMWAFAASLVAPDEEEEGIHHLTESLTSFHSEEL
ncbi:triadin isoform X1 [Haplochromis burtoni]|uniref:Triadin n=1 Tax=Haplochromis burtoni TaxID=8153 RepID=A0A3Q3C4B9_HAPBU|nr:triadin isoform X1 [Haplochromis burtoni]XP_005914316.1 triadin isoform X1 [Haplochromis burtoni]